MKITEKKHWLNGLQKRHNFMMHKTGWKFFWTYAFSVGNIGVLISGRPLEIEFFRLK